MLFEQWWCIPADFINCALLFHFFINIFYKRLQILVSSTENVNSLLFFVSLLILLHSWWGFTLAWFILSFFYLVACFSWASRGFWTWFWSLWIQDIRKSCSIGCYFWILYFCCLSIYTFCIDTQHFYWVIEHVYYLPCVYTICVSSLCGTSLTSSPIIWTCTNRAVLKCMARLEVWGCIMLLHRCWALV